jgi:hypothetical protein
MSRSTAVVAAYLLTALAFAASAQAAKEFEPNDTRETAYGPLEGGKSYTATFETDNDVDWYVFYIKTYSQMDFSATMVKSCEDYAAISLYDKDGNSETYFNTGNVNKTNHLLRTMNPGRYYLEVEKHYSCTGDRYSFRIDPATSITSSRECGEAIVSKDAIGSQLAAANKELTKSNESLASKTRAVNKAKKIVQRLKNRRRVPGWQKRQARRKLDLAKEARAKALKVMADLQGIISQHQQEITGAESQIATFC